MGSRRNTAEFKREAIGLVKQRGLSVRQAAGDLGLHPNPLHRSIKVHQEYGGEAIPGHGRMRPDVAEVARLKRELAKTKAERDILKKAIAYFAKDPS